MKYICSVLCILFLYTGSVLAEGEDNSIINELTKQNTKEISSENLQLKTFETCEDFKKVTDAFLKKYHSQYYFPVARLKGGAVSEFALEALPDSVVTSTASTRDDFSSTNEQVLGVSESEIIKTDGQYIYYYNDTNQYIYVIKAGNLQVVKKIRLPKHFTGVQLYLEPQRLVILATGYPQGSFQKKYWDASMKTYTIIYDVTNPEKGELIKAFMTEGSLSKSRVIGNQLYVISRKNRYSLFRGAQDADIKVEDILPRKLELIATEEPGDSNVVLQGIEKPYKVDTGYVSKCNEIEYILPDSDTDLGYPDFNLISIIDINDIQKPAKTKVIFGSLNEVYMSLDNLYITNSVYKGEPFRCSINGFCIMPFYPAGTNHTLIHKLSINGENLDYQTSTLVGGSPLTQYSMDEYKGHFRIITQIRNWGLSGSERHTNLYILDKDLQLKGSLTHLGGGEDFKSSRFIGEKLFLVTFKQVDPLFAIDVSQPNTPKVLGELKIPGYSTYLHPYDENHLIGLGYDTAENKYGGIYNNGVKVDLYQINYDKKCGDADLTDDEQAKCDLGDYKGIIVKQLHSLTLGEYGSNSEALMNPRMFLWNKARNTLLLPAVIYKNDKEIYYKPKDVSQGLYAITIDGVDGIKEKYSVTHMDINAIELERIQECSQYSQENNNETVCRKLIGGGQHCMAPKNIYVPKYCYEESTIGEYISQKYWDFKDRFIKRALWIGNNVYSFSDNLIMVSDLETGKVKKQVEMK